MKTEKCTLIDYQAGFCCGCGQKLIEGIWDKEPLFDRDTGEPYKRVFWCCPSINDKIKSNDTK